MFNNTAKTLEINPANFVSKFFFWWTVKLFRKGSQDGLTSEDIYTPLNLDESKTPANDLERKWNCIKENSSKPLFVKAIIQTFWLKYLYIVIFVILEQIILRNSQPFIMNWIIEYFTIEPTINVTRKDAFIYATIIIATIIAISFIAHHVYCISQILGIKIRVACCALIYKKILKLNKSAFKKNKRDQIINLLNNDVYNFDLLPLSLNFLWITFIQMIIIFPIVWQSIGLHVIVGFGALLTVVISMQGCIEIVDSTLRKMIEKLTDQRNQIVKEITIGIKIVKMYVLEKYFNKAMTKIRSEEVQQLRRSLHIRVFHGCLQGITCKIMVFVTLMSLSSEGVIFNSRITYNISVYYHILQLLAIIYLPISMNRIVEIYTMINKIQNFLLLNETCESSIKLNNLKNSKYKNDQHNNQLNKSSSGVEIELNEVSASWRINHPLQILNSIKLKFKSGEFCAVVGPAGSGKSSLLNLLLQELPVDAGTVRLFQIKNGASVDLRTTHGFVKSKPEITISYASQDPLLFSGTIKDNILFGLEYDHARYQEVCFLVKDFKELPNRDMTIVGEGGKSLSIDQKTKVNLARAVYRQADLYLLDDIFHGIDGNDSEFIFNECVLGFLQGKTRILVTDHLEYLKQADTIAVIEKVRIPEKMIRSN
ncbi:hypothetical protein KQX54_006001 [Cotesia glomerata]|uniref:Uncharacterized protein n=1 Tax=Cotesia glomerata TaxID=32391 RepID=A0AAV7HSJ2_COTGL|nr:hypothetical protein KQX54_006001 [Cotesia glomerata]